LPVPLYLQEWRDWKLRVDELGINPVVDKGVVESASYHHKKAVSAVLIIPYLMPGLRTVRGVDLHIIQREIGGEN